MSKKIKKKSKKIKINDYKNTWKKRILEKNSKKMTVKKIYIKQEKTIKKRNKNLTEFKREK